MATDYSVDNARFAVPHLIECARSRKTITYVELADKIGRHYRAVPHLLEHLLRVCQKLNIPPIGTIVVSKTTGLPGDGFIIDGGAKKLVYGGTEYRQRVSDEQQRIYTHQNWASLLHEYGLPDN
jgi:hypothetical protein